MHRAGLASRFAYSHTVIITDFGLRFDDDLSEND